MYFDIINIINIYGGKSMKLSIIICTYNTDISYVDECLNSIYSSTISTADFEVVFVDDGSTVDYSSIIEKYPIVYSKIENRGHLGARIYGISIAKGDYITFVDSDDTVSYNYHLPMLRVAEDKNADIVINDWSFRLSSMNRYCTKDTTICRDIDCRGDDEPLLLFFEQKGGEHSYFVFWNKIVRREIYQLAVSDVERVVGARRVVYAEDVLLNFFNYKYAKCVVNLHTGFYFYRIHDNQSVTACSAEKLLSQIETMSFVLGVMRDNIGANRYREKILDNLSEWGASMARYHYGTAKGSGYIELYEKIKAAYDVPKLRTPYKKDGILYVYVEVLGNNFTEIDKSLYELYKCDSDIDVSYSRNCKYIERFVKSISKIKHFSVRKKKNAALVIPKNDTPRLLRIIFSPFVIKIGVHTIKKGSKLRKFLKKKLV